jgi:hypothetical protein
MITPEFVMQKLAEPFDARDVAKPLKDEPLTRPLYNEYMRDSRKPKAPALPPRVQMQVGTPTLNQQRMDQDVASFGERLGVNSAGGSALGQKMNEDLSVQHTKAADEEVADARKKRKITTATVNGVVGRGRGRGGTPLQQVGNAVTAAAPVAKRDRIADIGKKIVEGIDGLGITNKQVEAEIAKRKPATAPAPAGGQQIAGVHRNKLIHGSPMANYLEAVDMNRDVDRYNGLYDSRESWRWRPHQMGSYYAGDDKGIWGGAKYLAGFGGNMIASAAQGLMNVGAAAPGAIYDAGKWLLVGR